MTRLDGAVAIVTGAAHGIGRAICGELVREGAAVWACDVLGEDLEASARTAGYRSRVVDVTEPGQVGAFVRDVGDVDILVNCAGGVAGQTMRPIDEVADADWRRILAINLDGAFHFTRAVAPAMKARGRGSIVNISSGAGRSYSLTGIQAYASAKAGLIGFTRQSARELGAYGIRVNCVAPGFIRSNPASERQWEAMGEEGQRRLLESIALRRLGQPAEIARVVVFFASEDAAFVTGQTISVDGGHWMLG
ncbi:MAG TPA: SDR family NAD(P)-dependent oxidoreductase [Methylomirabilota bacterium]|jgi:3-oxoacyl-[acyl-carrier protein] reductase|nr:SDR family NAD(P)-dependent oxidoreductase [Methylomirabilota bacterium]